MVSVFFADTIKAKAPQTFTTTSLILASPCVDRENMQALSAYRMPHTERRTQSIPSSGAIGVSGSFRCTSSATMTAFSLHHWRNTISAAAKKMLNNVGKARIVAIAFAPPQTTPNRRRHQVAHELSSHRGIVG